MAIVFGFDDDDLEPINCVERMDLLDDPLWLPDQLSTAASFFDLAVLDAIAPATAIDILLGVSTGSDQDD